MSPCLFRELFVVGVSGFVAENPIGWTVSSEPACPLSNTLNSVLVLFVYFDLLVIRFIKKLSKKIVIV